MSDLKSMIKAVAEAHNAKNPGRRISITDPMTREQSESVRKSAVNKRLLRPKNAPRKMRLTCPTLKSVMQR